MSLPARVLSVLAFAVPAILCFGLGIWDLTKPALWADELATWGAVRLSWSQLWQLSHSVDAVVFPYYAILKQYTALAGTSAATLRQPSVLAAALATLAVTALGRRAAGIGAGFVAGTLFGTLPAISRYAQEARPYAIVMLFAALSVLALARAMEVPSVARLGLYAVALALTGVFHPLSGLLVLAGHFVAIVLYSWRHRVRAGLWCLLSAVVGAVPMVILGSLAADQTAQVSWIALANLDSLKAAPDRLFLSAVTGGVVFALAVVACRREPPTVLCLSGAAFVPPVLLFVAGPVVHVGVARYLLAAVPPMVALAGVTATRFGRSQAAALLVVTVILGYPTQLDVRGPIGHGQASAKVAEIIGDHYRPGDVIVFPNTNPSIPWAPRDIYLYYLPAAERPEDVLAITPQRTNGHLLAMECPGASCLGRPPRIWVLRVDTSTDPFADMALAKRERLSGGYHVAVHWQYPLLGVFLLLPGAPKKS